MIDQIKKWIKPIGDFQLQNFTEKIQVDNKEQKIDLVTNIDKESEQILIAKISENYPDHSIIAEEGGSLNNNSAYQWIIDPLDGTVNYVHGYPVFGISVALYYQNKPKFGVVYYPYFDDFYVAEKNQGSYYNGTTIKVENNYSFSEAMISTGFPYSHQIDNKALNLFNKVLPKLGSIRRTGAAAYDLCQVAKGVFDGFWEIDLKIWDIAAGVLLIEEAGGLVTDLAGDNVYGNVKREVVAGNKDINQKLRKILNEGDNNE